MTEDQAAKYMIVGWVKDWPLSCYLRAVTGQSAPDFWAAHKVYTWLPNGHTSYTKTTARRHIADNFPVLNEKLWNATTNEERLALWPLLLAKKAPSSYRIDPAQRAAKSGSKALDEFTKVRVKRRERADKTEGFNWSVVK